METLAFGMPTLIENGTLRENVALCARLGLRFIELNMNFPEYQLGALADPEPFLRTAEQAGIYYTVHLDETLDPASFNPLVRNAYRETVRRAILFLKAVLPLRDRFGDPGQPLILNMHMSHGIHITLPDKKVRMYERDKDTYLAHFRSFADAVAAWIGDADIRLTAENTDGFTDFEREAIGILLEKRCFGLTWDIGHSKATGEKDVPFLLRHKDRLVHMHIHDGTETPPKNHLALGTGGIDIQDRLRTAEEVHARCVLETKTVRALEDSVRYLEKRGLKEPAGGGE